MNFEELHPDWEIADNNINIHRTFNFSDFIGAFGFMTKVAFIAEKMDHHPSWSNVYNQLHIELTTHSAGDIVADLDIMLAKQIDQLMISK